ncbi:hypothetical protein ACP70R_038820 [Stipagrostis hirtigluma subsp. patula]
MCVAALLAPLAPLLVARPPAASCARRNRALRRRFVGS